MAYRWHGRARVNPDYPQAWATCDRCGFNYNLVDLQWQWDWGAGFQMYNKRILVCDECYDKPAEFLRAIVIPPDPPALYNLRIEPYAVDEQGPTQTIIAELDLGTPTITALYLDLFDGDPSDGGSSILATLKGSATRTNFASSMSAPSALVSTNTAIITLVTNAVTSANLTWLAAYDSATAGSLLAAAAVVPQTVVMGNGLAFPIGDLRIQVTP
ncbi:MAG TPA: hypothetical protein VI358_18020 [Pseudolabrys sp.]